MGSDADKKNLDNLESQFNKLTITDSNKPLIITFANWPYLNVLLNWMEGLKRLSIDNYIVISFDEKLYHYLVEKKYKTILLKNIDNLSELWRLRITIFKYLVDKNIDFIHSDADAVWLKNPIPEYYDSFPSTDLMISQGTIWPENVQRLWGFVVCCGFFIMRSSPAMKMLWEKLEDSVLQTGDDQISMNYIIAGENIQWDIQSKYRVVFGKYHLLCSDQVIEGKGDTITVGVLPFKKFPRLHIPDTEPYISHVLTPKESKPKIEMLRKVGAWFLDDKNS